MKNLTKIIALGLVFFFSACSLTDLEGNLDNPNEVSVDKLDLGLLNNKVQAEFGDFFSLANDPSAELSRMIAMTGGNTYERAYRAESFNTLWNRGYQDVMSQINVLLTKSDDSPLFGHFSGSARILKAYTMLTLVDLFGDVPYSQALRAGEEGPAAFNPGVDNGRSIYNEAIALLDQAIQNLNAAPAATPSSFRDVYYGGNKARWIALANTLKLKALVNVHNVDQSVAGQIVTLLGADLVDTDAEEFTYKYGTASIPARSRHPWYRQMYGPNPGDADGYLSNHYMNVCFKQKGVEDPRWRFYFYRQVGSIAQALNDEPESIPCVISPYPSHYPPGTAFCSFDPGFFGREHGNNDGIPPDGRSLTCFGVYPAGGRADVNDAPDTGNNYQGLSQSGQGANGAGIEPIWMAAYTDFVKAEAALTVAGAGGDAAALVASGISKSIARVKAFGTAKGQTVPNNLLADEAAYQAEVAARMTAAADNNAKLEVVAKEYYIALWGNGVEAYNLYRRTQKPSDMQPMRASAPGKYIYSLIYPADFVNLNNSTQQKVPTAVNKVFWDNKGDNLSF
jgi:hypothetical protein